MKESNAPVIGRTPFQKWLDKYQGILYLIPWIIGFVVFKAFPFGQSLYYSFTDMNFFKSGTTFVGLQNYITAFTTTKITKALIITFKYAFITVPLKLIFALFIAYILNFKIACVNLFRTVYYIPSILGGSVAIAVLWKAVFSKDGLLNTVLRAVTFGLVQGPEWLSDPHYALWIICFLRIWQFGSAMVLFLAALKGVPADLYEAATIDGAGKWKQFFSITVPMITPIIFYNLVTQICQAFQEFNGPFIITNGGPRNSTTLISILGGSVAIAVLWKAVFSKDGLLNTVLRFVSFGLFKGPEWLSDPSYALWIICFLRIWQFGSAMVLFLAALKGVPADLYEAATIDGAGKWRQFFSITVPMITPIIFYNLVTQICQAFQEFNGPYIITNGGPRGSTTLISLLVYNYAFKSYDMGMASALAWIMFIIVCILTIIAFTSQKKWVYYSDER